MLAILFANAFSPLIDYSVLQKHIKQIAEKPLEEVVSYKNSCIFARATIS